VEARIPTELAAFLASHGNGQTPFPLIATPHSSVPLPPDFLFADCRMPREARAGLYLYLGHGLESHEISQACSSTEGCYWHGIYHRLEPDAWNAKYWFRRVGPHAIHPELATAAKLPSRNWDHAAFVDQVARAIQSRDAAQTSQCEHLQLLEWRFLFVFCAESKSRQATTGAPTE
jgi:hypothetical protein